MQFCVFVLESLLPHVQLRELCFYSATQAQPALVQSGNRVHTPMYMTPVSDISVTLCLNTFAFRHACKIPEHLFRRLF